MKSVLRFLAGAAILTVGIFVMNGLIGMKTDPPVSSRPVMVRPVRAMPIALGDNRPSTPIEGRVDAMYRMSLFAEVNGVLSIGGKEFREGMKFAKGETLLRLDDSEPRAALVAQRSAFLQLLSGIMADVQMDFPESAAKWMAYLKNFDVASPLAEWPELSDERERLFMANRGVLGAYHNIRSAEERLSKYSIVAPFDGVLVEAVVQPGALVRSGQPLGTLVGDGAFEIKSAVHARYLETIAKGDSVSFQEESGRQVATGRVVRMASNVDASTQSASIFCQVQPSGTMPLRDGRYLSGQVVSAAISNSCSIRVDLLSTDDELFVLQESADSWTLRSQSVEVLFRSQEVAIVLGLKEGTLILAEPVNGTYDGMPVSLIQ
ncbi:MAG: efflux RND transporter periplasmic adaptor subunit [Flavobacteriales bacterium]